MLTQQDKKDIEEIVHGILDSMIPQIVDAMYTPIAKRFDKLEIRMDKLEMRMDKLEAEVRKNRAAIEQNRVAIEKNRAAIEGNKIAIKKNSASIKKLLLGQKMIRTDIQVARSDFTAYKKYSDKKLEGFEKRLNMYSDHFFVKDQETTLKK